MAEIQSLSGHRTIPDTPTLTDELTSKTYVNDQDALKRSIAPVITSLANVANAGTISITASSATVHRVTTTGATATLGVPANPVDGDTVQVEVLANAGLSLTINASILLTSGITTPISVVINKRLFLMLRCVGSTWYLLASAPQS